MLSGTQHLMLSTLISLLFFALLCAAKAGSTTKFQEGIKF